MRFFNTEGPVCPDDHYAIQPLDRMDPEELLGMIRSKRYFVLHAPRQTGKTSALIALRDLLNGGEAGDFRCVNVNVEAAQVARDEDRRARFAFPASGGAGAFFWRAPSGNCRSGAVRAAHGNVAFRKEEAGADRRGG